MQGKDKAILEPVLCNLGNRGNGTLFCKMFHFIEVHSRNNMDTGSLGFLSI